MKNIEIKLEFDKSVSKQSNTDIAKQIQKYLDNPGGYRTFKVNPRTSVETTKTYLENKFDATVCNGCSDGCYGARTGGSTEGLTLWLHPEKLTDRYVDAEYGEQVNPYHLLKEHGELVDGLDGETFEQYAEELDLETKSDNTYNFATDYGSENSENAGFMFDFQFTTLEKKDGGMLVAVMFHCGGDPRGNYTEKQVWKFKYVDDFYSVVFPTKYLTEEVV